MDTLELTCTITPKDPFSEILIAQLAENGFDSFVTTPTGIIAYGKATINEEEALANTLIHSSGECTIKIERNIIPQQNWNANWEANFPPVFVESYATILAPFHDSVEAVGMKVIIQPQMSFGTGHHQTTWLMTKALFELQKMPDRVLDMGTGTGVLAIVAEKLGASEIRAIDIEEWSVENAIENAERNQCSKIRCSHGDVDLILGEKFGLILANINKNVLKAHIPSYANALESGGVLLLSGFFRSDVEEMIDFATKYSLKMTRILEKEEWACVQLEKTVL